MKYVILSQKTWNNQLVEKLQTKFPEDSFMQIAAKEDFTAEKLQDIKPDKILIPHWSYIIPESIFANYECIVFHMTDLPFGRGGSPLQNLIVRGIKQTKISALRVEKGLDTPASRCYHVRSVLHSAPDPVRGRPRHRLPRQQRPQDHRYR